MVINIGQQISKYCKDSRLLTLTPDLSNSLMLGNCAKAQGNSRIGIPKVSSESKTFKKKKVLFFIRV